MSSERLLGKLVLDKAQVRDLSNWPRGKQADITVASFVNYS